MPSNFSPARPTVPALASSSVSLRRILRLLLFAVAFLAGTSQASAELFQNITVNGMSRELVRVERIETPFSELTKAVAAQVRGPKRVRVKIFISITFDKQLTEQVMDACRKGGATSFFIVHTR
jgi:hypothetical protein